MQLLPPSDADADADATATGAERGSEPARRARLGLLIGAFAGAATVGTLVGFGLRDGAALRPFASVGRQALALDAAHTGGARILATGAGLVLHLAVVVAWAMLFALVAAGWHGWKRWAAAAGAAVLAFLADRFLVPDVWRLGDAPGVSVPQRIALYVVLSLALALGMRVALSSTRQD